MALRRAAAAVFVITALLVQLVGVNGLGLPGGSPNLVLAVVLAFALVEGPGPGMAYGFVGGLLADMLSVHTVGRLALVWTVAGYLAGLLAPDERPGERPLLVPVLAIGVLTGAATLGYAILDVIFGAGHESLRRIAEQVAATTVYAFVLAPFAYLVVRGVLGRLRQART